MNSDDQQEPSPASPKPQAAKPAVAKRTASPPAAGAANSDAAAKTEVRFEDAFRRLEALVGEMEKGELPLEALLQRFEEGVKLVRYCNQFLKQAQQRVEQYVEQKDGHWVLKELDGNS